MTCPSLLIGGKTVVRTRNGAEIGHAAVAVKKSLEVQAATATGCDTGDLSGVVDGPRGTVCGELKCAGQIRQYAIAEEKGMGHTGTAEISLKRDLAGVVDRRRKSVRDGTERGSGVERLAGNRSWRHQEQETVRCPDFHGQPPER